MAIILEQLKAKVSSNMLGAEEKAIQTRTYKDLMKKISVSSKILHCQLIAIKYGYETHLILSNRGNTDELNRRPLLRNKGLL